MSGPETGARRITGQPDYGMAPDYYGGSGCDDDEKHKIKLVIKKDSPLAEGEVLKFPSAKSAKVMPGNKPRDIKAKLRDPGRPENKDTGWMRDVPKKKPESLLQKVKNYVKKKV